jgi:hypothetical protein
MVNELFQDVLDGHNPPDGYLSPLTPEVQRLMARTWQATQEGRGIGPIDKYDLLLGLAGADPLNRDTEPFHSAQLLVRLRNVVAHYTPEEVAADVEHRLALQLRPRFPANRLMERSLGHPWWPDHCLGAGCAKWAAQSAMSLADYVTDTIGLTPNYRRLRDADWAGHAL